MGQKIRAAPKRAIWLCAILAGVIATAQASAINFNRSTYKGCMQQCVPKHNSLNYGDYEQGKTGSLYGRLFGAGVQQVESHNSVHFELGQTYSYQIRSENQAKTIFATKYGNTDNDAEMDQLSTDKYDNIRNQLIGIEATAFITPISECELSLQLRDVKIDIDQQKKQHYSSDREIDEIVRKLQVPILFGYKHGVVTEVCTDEIEDVFALNFKKSIISALQTTPRLSGTKQFKVTESDFNGDCETMYTITEQSSGKYIVNKRKELSKCENEPQRIDTYRSWQNALLKRQPVKSFTQCTQTIVERQLRKVRCDSVRAINTIAVPHYAVHLESKLEIVAKNVYPTGSQPEVDAQVPERWVRHPHRLLMSMPSMFADNHHHHPEQKYEKLADGRAELRKTLAKLCADIESNGDRVSSSTPKYVQTLAHVLRRSSQEDVQFVWKNMVQTGTVCAPKYAKKITDLFVHTAASVMDHNSAMIVRDELLRYADAVKSGDKNALRVARHLSTIVSFAAQPDLFAVKKIVPELIEKFDDEKVILSLSALIAAAKKNHQHHYDNEQQKYETLDDKWLLNVHESIFRKVTAKLASNPIEHEVSIVRLFNAIENIDIRKSSPVTVETQKRLVTIIADRQLPLAVRIAAIKSVPHVVPVHEVRAKLLELISEKMETNELRIAAYLALIHSHVSVQELQRLLSNVREQSPMESEDVQNYIYSHQKYLRTTEDMRMRTLLPLDAPVFPEPLSYANVFVSRHYAQTFANPRTRIGATVEAAVVWERASNGVENQEEKQSIRVPRSITLNLTLPVAEQEIPIVEVTIRQMHMERSLLKQFEQLKRMQKSPKAIVAQLRHLMARVQYEGQQQAKRSSHYYNENVTPKMQVMLNIDGKNVLVWDSVECAKEHNYAEMDNVIAQLYARLPVKFDETMVMMPLKHRVQLPTASGIPVNFELNSTLVFSLDAHIVGQREQSLDVHLKPTVIVEQGVGLEADLGQYGKSKRVQFVNRFISAPTLRVKAQIHPNNRKFQLKILLPEDEQVVARFETEFTNDNDEQGGQMLLRSLNAENLDDEEQSKQHQKSLIREVREMLHKQMKRRSAWYAPQDSKSEKCIPMLDRLFGFTYCAQTYSIDDLKNSLATSASRKLIYLSQIKLVKTDRTMEGIELGWEMPELFTPENGNTADELKFKLHFDTPNSRVSRRFDTEFVVRIPQQSTEKLLVQFNVQAAEKKFAGQLVALNHEQQKSLKIELLTDGDKRQFYLDLNAVAIVKEAAGKQLKLKLQLQPTPYSTMQSFEGELQLIGGGSTNVADAKKTKIVFRLAANEKSVIDFSIMKSGGRLFDRTTDLKVSSALQFNLFGVRIESNAALQKDVQSGTLKSNTEIRYNRFLSVSRRSRSEMETISFGVQYTGFNQPWFTGETVKKFAHITVRSTQMPRWNQELTYQIKGVLPAEFAHELTYQWSNDEAKRVHFSHECKQLSNARTRNVKHQTKIELQIKPIELHYHVHFTLDVEQPQQQAKTFSTELQVQNRKTEQTEIEARFAYVVTGTEPLRMEANGEIKMHGGKSVFVYRDNLREESKGVFRGKTVIETPKSHIVHRSLPSKIVVEYEYKQNESPIDRIATRNDRSIKSVHNMIANLVNRFEKLQYEIVADYVHQRKSLKYVSVIELSAENRFQLQSRLIKGGLDTEPTTPIVLYTSEIEFFPREKSLKMKLDSEKLDQLQASIEVRYARALKKLDVKLETARWQHETRAVIDREQPRYEFVSQTKKDQKVYLEIDASKKGPNDEWTFKVVSPLFETELELENVKLRTVMRKRSLFTNEHHNSLVKFGFKLPGKRVLHQTTLKTYGSQRQLTLETETRVADRNLLKAAIMSRPEEKSLTAEYATGYVANLKFAKVHQQQQNENALVYEFVAEYRIDAKQLTHKTVARWIVKPRFHLLTFQSKNHLGPKVVYDLAYRCNEQNPSAEYAHQFVLSSRDTHIELHLSQFGLEYASPYGSRSSVSPKALFTLKTKSFGGVDHRTELKNVDLESKQFAVQSNTLHRGETIAQIEMNIAAKRGAQSQLKLRFANDQKMQIRFVPFESISIDSTIGDRWQHSARFVRKVAQKQLSFVIESVDKRNNERWTVRGEHQCDAYTTAKIDTPVVRGDVELRLDSERMHNLHIELHGGVKRSYAGYEHVTDAKFNPIKRELTLKSYTKKPQIGEVANIEAHLYATLRRPSTINFESPVLPVRKFELKYEPKIGAEIEMRGTETVTKVALKKMTKSYNDEIVVRLETRSTQDNAVVVLVDASLEQSMRKMEAKIEIGQRLKRYISPLVGEIKFDTERREFSANAHHHATDNAFKFQAKLKNLDDAYVELAWDAKRDPTKQVTVHVHVQDGSESNRFVASIRGNIIDRPFEVKIDVPRTTRTWLHDAHRIEAEMTDRRDSNARYVFRYVRSYESNQYRSSIEMRKNDFVALKSELKIEIEQENKKSLSLKTESHYGFDVLNVDLELTRECAHKECQTKAVGKFGATESRQTVIKFEGANVMDALRGELVIVSPHVAEQTVKFEFIKPESKLQINVFNQAGRQLDLNVDLARSLQKKFQLVSFLESIPTIDIEVAHGENSRVVLQASFQQEKKLELSINWFGQWRRDFKLEALFKCFAKPAIELLITSRHPAGVDEIDAMLKLANAEYAAKWSRKFDAEHRNWNMKSVLQINGEMKYDLDVQAVTKSSPSVTDDKQERVVKEYTAQLAGLYEAKGHLTVVVRPSLSSRSYNYYNIDNEKFMLESIKCEFGTIAKPRAFTVELYAADREQSSSSFSGMMRTGFRVASNEKPIFGLMYHSNGQLNEQNRRISMLRLQLPTEIEYVLRNEIEYHHRDGKQQIRSIRSELKKQQPYQQQQQLKQQPIYQTKIYFDEDPVTDLKVIRVEVKSSQFGRYADKEMPKIVEIRYNFAPKQCHILKPKVDEEYHHHRQSQQYQQYQESMPYDSKVQCWQVYVYAGGKHQQQQVPQYQESEKHFTMKIGAEYMKYPIDSKHSNRTFRFTIKSTPIDIDQLPTKMSERNEVEERREQSPLSIDFTTVAHISVRSVGVWFDNRNNRYGQHKQGLFYLDIVPSQSKSFLPQQKHSMINMYARNLDKRQPTKDIGFEMHVSPQDIRRTVSVDAKWDKDSMRRMVVGELPELHDMMTSNENGYGRLDKIRSRIVRDLVAEIRHKVAEMKRAYDHELLEPLTEEIDEVKRQLSESEDEIAQRVTRVTRRTIDTVRDAYERVQLQKAFENLITNFAHWSKSMQRSAINEFVQRCESNRMCGTALNELRQYEIQKYLRNQVDTRYHAMKRAIKRAVPENLLKSIESFAREFLAEHEYVHRQSYSHDDDEYDNYDEEKMVKKPKTIMRHAVHHVLKMAQPEMSQVLLHHVHKISKQLNNNENYDNHYGNNDYGNNNKYRSDVDGYYYGANNDSRELRGALHDMAVDVVEQMQSKTTEQQEQKPFWSKYFGGEDYASKYASKYNHSKQQYGDNNNNDDDDDYIANKQKSNNFVFSPKRGEFKLYNNKQNNNYHDEITTSSYPSSSTYWTRS